MTVIKVRENESIEDALRRFKRICERDGIMQEIKRREHYETPSIKRKRKMAELKRKLRRKGVKRRI